jgi:hypothetical protein
VLTSNQLLIFFEQKNASSSQSSTPRWTLLWQLVSGNGGITLLHTQAKYLPNSLTSKKTWIVGNKEHYHDTQTQKHTEHNCTWHTYRKKDTTEVLRIMSRWHLSDKCIYSNCVCVCVCSTKIKYRYIKDTNEKKKYIYIYISTQCIYYVQ